MDLHVNDLSVARGGVPVLTGVNLTLKPGQALILHGPNGSGKTTLLRTIAGLQPAVSGEIIGAEDQVAYGAHADGLKAMLSVTENLRFWAQIFGHTNIDAAVDAFELHPLKDRLAGTLSAGQKRRLGLARLLVTGRPVWVLDEPTVSLDNFAVKQFATVVRTHLAQGGMALIATHVDLGLEGEILDVSQFRADPSKHVGASDEAFL